MAVRKYSIDVRQKYAILSNGEIEPLFYENGEPREIEREDNFVYLVRDVCQFNTGADGTQFFRGWALHRDQIICTADKREELIDIALARQYATTHHKTL